MMIKSCMRRVAGLIAVVALSAPGAWAEADSKSQATRVFGPKQVGPWTLEGYHHTNADAHCAAERPVAGAAGRGANLQVGVLRTRAGYWLALGAAGWELKPDASFPVELIADPVLRSEATARALAARIVAIELGSDRALMQRLATVPKIEIKTARTTFKMPTDSIEKAVAELDACHDAIRQPSNPFAAPEAAKAAPKEAPATTGKARAEPRAESRPQAAPASAASGDDSELTEERTFLTVRGPKGPYRLEALVVRPAKAEGRLPVALITHGKNGESQENRQASAELMLPQARDLALRGWLAAAVMRRGYGRSDGLPGVSRSNGYMSCENGDLVRGFDMEADDLEGALKAIAARPDADGSRAIAIGSSFGGAAALALAARKPAGLLGVVNVSGGVWRSHGEGACDHDALVAAMVKLGERTPIVTLWLYAENDSLFPPALVRRMRDAYASAGGRADLRMLPPVLHDGHNLFADFTGRGRWLRALDSFLQAQVLPNANTARAAQLMREARLPAKMRQFVESYLSAPSHKALAISRSNATYWSAWPDDLEKARAAALARCRKQSGAECTVAMENHRFVLPAATETSAAGAAQ